MTKFFRKTLIYLIIAMLAVPTWTVTGLLKAERASASNENDNVVISEVQVAGNTAKDEFVELYNPTPYTIDITGWKLSRETESGSPSNLVSSLTGRILSHGYYLVAGQGLDVPVDLDAQFNISAILAKDNTVILYSADDTNVDEVGMGSAIHFEGSPALNPADGESIERKYDSELGIYLDTDNNASDFQINTSPDPQSVTTDLLASISDKTTIKHVQFSKTIAKGDETINSNILVEYPANVSDVKADYKVDSLITSDVEIPVGTKLNLFYNAIPLGEYTFEEATTEIYLSEIINKINASLPTRVSLNTELGASTWGFEIAGLNEGIYNLSFEAVTSKDDFVTNYVLGSALEFPVIVDFSVVAPTNVLAAKNGEDIKITWDAVSDLLSGVKGYDVYLSTDNFVTAGVKLNDPLVPVNNFTYLSPINGKYTFKVVAFDIAGNESDFSDLSNSVEITKTTVFSPKIISSVSGKTINVSWTKVTGADRYYIYAQPKSNGLITSTNHGVPTKVKNATAGTINVSEYGEYYVTVTAVDAYGNESPFLTDFTGQLLVSVSAPVAVNAAPVAAAAPVSVAAPKASAAVTTPSETTNTPTVDDSGKIKGDESTTTDNATKVNWTPWIVLFVLIILAGAATGGYFYWFNGEEEVAAVVREPKKSAKVETVVKETQTTKKPNKKSKRW